MKEERIMENNWMDLLKEGLTIYLDQVIPMIEKREYADADRLLKDAEHKFGNAIRQMADKEYLFRVMVEAHSIIDGFCLQSSCLLEARDNTDVGMQGILSTTQYITKHVTRLALELFGICEFIPKA